MNFLFIFQSSASILKQLTLTLPRGMVTTPRDFSPKQKESDLSNLGSLKYIFCGHFNEKIGGTGGELIKRLAVKDGG